MYRSFKREKGGGGEISLFPFDLSFPQSSLVNASAPPCKTLDPPQFIYFVTKDHIIRRLKLISVSTLNCFKYFYGAFYGAEHESAHYGNIFICTCMPWISDFKAHKHCFLIGVRI